MRLARLFDDLPSRDAGIEISSLAYDNRLVRPGTLFFCVPGFTRDGHDFARRRGRPGRRGAGGRAAAEPRRPRGRRRPACAPRWRRPRPRFYGDPTARLPDVGVTGTNGKTTTRVPRPGAARGRRPPDRPARHGQERDRRRRARGPAHHAGGDRPAAHLPGDARRRRPSLRDGGLLACARSCTAPTRSTSRPRSSPTSPRTISTSIPTMEDYFARQAPAVHRARAADAAIVNVDDPYGARLAASCRRGDHVRARMRAADLPRRRASQTGLDGSTLHASARPTASSSCTRRCAGEFNVYNVLGALAAARALGVPAETCVAAIADRRTGPGPLSRPSTRASRSRCWSTTPTPRTRWRTCCAAARDADRGRGCTSCSAAAATATAASGR